MDVRKVLKPEVTTNNSPSANIVISPEQFGEDSSTAYDRVNLDSPKVKPKRGRRIFHATLFQSSSGSSSVNYKPIGDKSSGCCCFRRK